MIQQDTQEFNRILLEDLNAEFNVYDDSNNLNKQLVYSDITNKMKSAQEYHDYFLSKENSFIINIFYLQIVSIYTCQCNHITYSFGKFTNIPIILPDNMNNISLDDLLIRQFKQELVDFEDICINCRKKLKIYFQVNFFFHRDYLKRLSLFKIIKLTFSPIFNEQFPLLMIKIASSKSSFDIIVSPVSGNIFVILFVLYFFIVKLSKIFC